MSQFEPKGNDKVKEVMNDKLKLIAYYIQNGMNKYAKLETKSLKAYLDCQLSIAKKEARDNKPKSWLEKIESN